MRWPVRPWWNLLLPLIAGPGGCILATDGSDGGTPPVATIAVTPPTFSVQVGETRQLYALPRDAEGGIVSGAPVEWRSIRPAVARVDAEGVVTGIAAGTTQIVCESGGVTQSASATVLADTPPPVAAVRVTPAVAEIAIGATAAYAAQPVDAGGSPVGGWAVTWSVVDPSIAELISAGVVRGVAAGETQVRAAAGGASGTASVRVVPAIPRQVASVTLDPVAATIDSAASRTFTATPRDSVGIAVPGRTAAWITEDPSIASVSSAGVVTGQAPGRTAVVATVDGVAGRAPLTILGAGTSAGAWPNEPAGYTTLSDQSWDLLNALGWVLQFGTALIGLDLAAPASPPGVLVITYPIGFAGGEAPGTMMRQFTPTRRLFMGVWWKASDPWQGHESNVNKIQFLFPTTGGDITMVMYGSPGGPYELRVIPQFPGMASEWLRPNVAQIPVTLGVWHRIEWVVDYAAAHEVGTVRWWLDGHLIGDYREVPFPDAGMQAYKISPTWGGVGDVKRELDYFWFDQTYLSQP